MILYRDKNNPRGLGNHYNTIIKKSINRGRKYTDFGQEAQNPELVDANYSRRQIINENESSTSSSGTPSQGDVNTPNNSDSESEDDGNIDPDFSNE